MRTAFRDITNLTYICSRITLIIAFILDHEITNTSWFCNFWTAIRHYICVIFVLRFMVTLFYTITTICSIHLIYIISWTSVPCSTIIIKTETEIGYTMRKMLTQWYRKTYFITKLQWRITSWLSYSSSWTTYITSCNLSISTTRDRATLW